MDLNNENSSQLTNAQGRLLVRLARQTIQTQLGKPPTEEESSALKQALGDDIFQIQRGVFVTLKISHNLRGCIGSLAGFTPIRKGIKENAINAAFHDPRFKPLTSDELSKVTIEVSVLNHPEPLAYTDGDDLISKLRPQLDGVIIRKGLASSTFLPQVWELLPKPHDFLQQLCLKAGLPADEWRTGQLEVSTYQVQYFEENALRS
jgi:AmmeMemoRadiSam system protein A